MSGFLGSRPKNSEESDREFSKNYEIKREFLPSNGVNVQKFLWKIFDDVLNVEDEITKVLINDEDEREEIWLHLVEECLFLIGPSDPQREQILFQFFRWLFVPKKKTTLKRLSERLHQLVYEIDVGMEVKYNVLLVLLFLGDLAQKWKQSESLPLPVGSILSNSDDSERDMVPSHKYVFNNGMVNLIWMLANSSHIYTKILALSVLHNFIENLDSPFPPPIEEMLEAHVRRALANNKNPELQFLAYYIAKHTFGEQISIRTEDLEEERIKKNKIAGKGKIYIQPHDGIMLDSDGLTVRNNTLQMQVAHVHQAISVALTKGTWYWEIIVCSNRLTWGGYGVKGNEVHGLKLDIKRAGDIFGFALYSDEKLFRVFSSSGEEFSSPVAETCKAFMPCIRFGPLQQVIFNFGESQLMKDHPAVRDLFQKNKTKSSLVDLFSTVKCTLPPFDYIPPNTYRQQITLPLKKGKNIKVEKKVAEKEPEEKEQKNQNSPAAMEKGSTTLRPSVSAIPWIPKERKKEIPLIPISEEDKEEKDPEEFCCPISRSIMIDPVIASDGKTYERSEIEKWLKKGNNTSPITREVLSNDLEPNLKLKGEIETWQKMKDSQNKNPERKLKSVRENSETDLSESDIKSARTPEKKKSQRTSRKGRKSEMTLEKQLSSVQHRNSEQLSPLRHRKSKMIPEEQVSPVRQNSEQLSPVGHRKSKMIPEEQVSPVRQNSEQLSPVGHRKSKMIPEEQQSPVRKMKVEVDTEANLTEKERRKKLEQHFMDDDDDEFEIIDD